MRKPRLREAGFLPRATELGMEWRTRPECAWVRDCVEKLGCIPPTAQLQARVRFRLPEAPLPSRKVGARKSNGYLRSQVFVHPCHPQMRASIPLKLQLQRNDCRWVGRWVQHVRLPRSLCAGSVSRLIWLLPLRSCYSLPGLG